MVRPDHTCFWTRRRMTELTRGPHGLSGAGIPLTVLNFAASRLGETVAVSTTPSEPDNLQLAVGGVSGILHDGCFLALEPYDPGLVVALLEGIRELHTYYLRGRSAPPAAFDLVRRVLQEDVSVRIHSRDTGIEISSFPDGASFIRRMLARRVRFDAA